MKTKFEMKFQARQSVCILGNVPCPIVYGAVVDSACLVWEKSCGEKGACWLYDTKIFRMFYHG